MASQENQVENKLNNSKVESTTPAATPLEKSEITPTQKKNETPITEIDDDVDLSDIVSNLMDPNSLLDDPEFNLPDSSNEAYKSIMSLCSNTTSNIKKSIYDILNSRDAADGTEDNTTTELQESLNKKMEDFKKVISGCLDESEASTSEAAETGVVIEDVTENAEVQSGVVIEEVTEDVEVRSGVVIEEVTESSGKSPDSDKVAKDAANSGSLDSKNKGDTKGKNKGDPKGKNKGDPKGKTKGDPKGKNKGDPKNGGAPESKTGKAEKKDNVGLNNSKADTVATKAVDAAEKNDKTKDVGNSNADTVATKTVDAAEKNDKTKDVGLNNSNADTVAAKPVDAAEKDNPKSSNINEKKSELPDLSSINSTKALFQALSEVQIPDNEVLKNLLAQEEEKQSKKQKNSATKKKGEKTIDQIMKSLGNGTTEEKLHILCRRHAETLDEYRLVEPRMKQLERQIIAQQREKEATQAELNRMILAKSRLEGLCREMQRQSKAVKDESMLRIKEEEEKRKEVANKFQSTLNDISSLMQENSKKNIQLREENAELATKLKGLVDNYELWEQNMSKVVQQKELEAQLAKAKHAKVNLLLKQETEKFLREKQSLLENLSELQKRCTVLTQNELQLRTELSDYTSKYEEFQSVLTNSSKVFSTFKNDMETTSKKIKKLEKETNVYKQKWESSNKALLDMISHKEKQDKDFSSAQQKIICLEKLCRALQAERNELQNQINTIASSNSVPTTNPEVPSLTTEAKVA